MQEDKIDNPQACNETRREGMKEFIAFPDAWKSSAAIKTTTKNIRLAALTETERIFFIAIYFQSNLNTFPPFDGVLQYTLSDILFLT